MGYGRQLWTLTGKNLRIAVRRHWLSTSIRAVWAPIIYMFFIAYMKNFFVPPAEYGFGSPTPIRGFIDALQASSGGRDTVAFVNNGNTGGAIQELIDYISVDVRTAGKTAVVLETEEELLTTCRNSLRGTSGCFGAAVFYSSPTEGDAGFWNYTLRADGALGANMYVNQEDNDVQIYILPFQHHIDMAIVNQFGNGSQTIPNTIDEYPFTSRTGEQRDNDIRRLYMNAVIRFLGIAYILGIIGVVYHLVGRMAFERELGMSQLIEAMVPNRRRWHTQAVRLLSTHLAFDIIWAPGWIVMAIILKVLVFTETSFGIVIGWQLLSGLAFSSWSIMGASLFHKAQLSGIVVIIVSLILAIVVQVQTPDSTGAIVALSLIFTPMNYILNVIYLGRFERLGQATDLTQGAPPGQDGNSTWDLPGIVFWVFLIIQIFVYPIIGAFIERWRYGTASKARKLTFGDNADSTNAITLRNFSKSFVPSWWATNIAPKLGGDKRSVVQAVKGMDLTVLRGQILCLLGANGAGKSTTLDAITGLDTITGGEIEVDSHGGIGYCPQKNVLWDELTVFEHVRIFAGLKSIGKPDDKATIETLIRACDLEHKTHAKSKTLSGGQKRKLQLAMMFTGGSHVCCIDEVSSGVDPLSRRKIWDILLQERGVRTLLMTTHFLDEADVLADHIALMSKGLLKAEGSAAELKHRYGEGYRVQVMRPKESGDEKALEERWDGMKGGRTGADSYTFICEDSAEAAGFLQEVEKEGFTDYTVHGPAIEDVFLKLSEEAHEQETLSPISLLQERRKDKGDIESEEIVNAPKSEERMSKTSDSDVTVEKGKNLDLLTGEGISLQRQTWILFRKRLTVLKRNYIPYILAVILPIAVAGFVTFFLGDEPIGCSPSDSVNDPGSITFGQGQSLGIVVGPEDRIDRDLFLALANGNESALQFVNSFEEFQDRLIEMRRTIRPGGFWLGDTPTMAYVADFFVYFGVVTQNLLDQALSGQRIATQYREFQVPFSPSTGDSLQLVFYFGLAMVAFPGFFALYPAIERMRKVRALHYSNGVRAAPLWLAYMCFDFIFVLLISVLVTVIWAGVSSVWYHVEYLFVVFFLYGLASTLFSYVVSLYTSSQLATFAWAVGYQASIFALYFLAYLSIQTYAPPYAVDNAITIAHFTMAVLAPSGSLLRSLLLTLNEFSITCHGDQLASYAGGITVYGGPILYLIIQSFLMFIWLVVYDSGYRPAFLRRFKKKSKTPTDNEAEPEAQRQHSKDVADEITRTVSGKNGLQVQHLTKSFSQLTAVDDVTFNVAPSECFALLGPNGAGKSTTISLIRGDLHPDNNGGDVLVESISVQKHRAAARRKLGVCPQFDAMDTMTVAEHLKFYAQARGVSVPSRNVDALIAAVNLEEYRDRIAHNLSGGNKRKLSLAIALIGNPAVLLLDEPSSGMDAANKRFLWKTLIEVIKGRSMLITTHSMEEADKLADRAGIMATRMLALGTSEELRDRFGESWYVQATLRGAPHVAEEDTRSVSAWIQDNIEGAEMEPRMWYGQLRFSVPIKSCGVARLFKILEDKKEELNLEYYSVSRATLDQVFLEVVGRHNVEEEGQDTGRGNRKGKMSWWRQIIDDM